MSKLTRKQRRAANNSNHKAVAVRESAAPEFVDRYSQLPSWLFGGSPHNSPYTAALASTMHDRVDGSNRPFLETEQDLALVSGMARFITETHLAAKSVKNNLVSYIIGKGFTWKVKARKSSPTIAPASLINKVQRIVDKFIDDNNFTCDLDKELFWRARRDGEFLNTFTAKRDRRILVRQIEPVQLAEPTFPVFDAAQFWQQYKVHVPCATNWKFGVHKADHDEQDIFGYCVRWDDNDWTYYPARYCDHHKQNVDRIESRGRSDFYPAWKWLKLQARLLENTGEGAAELAAIAYIIQYANATRSQVNSFVEEKAETSMTIRGAAAGGSDVTYRKHYRQPGSSLHVGKGQEYLAGPMGAERGQAFVAVAGAILQQLGATWCMSEGQISGNDSNNNFASSVTAGSRFWAYAVTSQTEIGQRFWSMLWKAIEIAFYRGDFDEFSITWEQLKEAIELTYQGSLIDQQNALDQESIREKRFNNGVIDRDTWKQEAGYEPDVVQLADAANGTGDADGGIGADITTLNGAQIDSARSVLMDIRLGNTSDVAAVELLVGVGIPRDRAGIMVKSIASLPPPTVGADGKPLPQATQAGSGPGGEFGGASRRQFTNNQKGTMEILSKFTSKALSEPQALAFLTGIGWSEQRAQALIDDAKDGNVDDPLTDQPDQSAADPKAAPESAVNTWLDRAINRAWEQS